MLHILTVSHKLKYEKQTTFLVGAIIQKYSSHVINCLSDLFYLDIQKYLMFEVFTSSAKQDKQIFGICTCTNSMHSFNTIPGRSD